MASNLIPAQVSNLEWILQEGLDGDVAQELIPLLGREGGDATLRHLNQRIDEIRKMSPRVSASNCWKWIRSEITGKGA